MNFIVGFLYLLLQDNTKTFNFLRQVISQHNMEDLFSQGVPLLKKHFYQMDRLLYFHFPDIFAFLRNEGIRASSFSPSWFITLFTNSLQYSTKGVPGDLLLVVWDVFLLYGWKAIFKVGIFIVETLMRELITTRIDHIMMAFGNVPKGSFFEDPMVLDKFRKEFKKIKINNDVVEALNKEYMEIIGKANKGE